MPFANFLNLLTSLISLQVRWKCRGSDCRCAGSCRALCLHCLECFQDKKSHQSSILSFHRSTQEYRANQKKWAILRGFLYFKLKTMPLCYQDVCIPENKQNATHLCVANWSSSFAKQKILYRNGQLIKIVIFEGCKKISQHFWVRLVWIIFCY